MTALDYPRVGDIRRWNLSGINFMIVAFEEDRGMGNHRVIFIQDGKRDMTSVQWVMLNSRVISASR